MPQIIKRGVDPRQDKYRLTCDCGTVALFGLHEVQSEQRENDSWVVCPVCTRSCSLRVTSKVQRVNGEVQ